LLFDRIYDCSYNAVEECVRHVICNVEQLSRIEVAEMHPWVYRQLRKPFVNLMPGRRAAIAWDPDQTKPLSGDFVLKQLISGLSVDKAPSLQNELQFLFLYTFYRPEEKQHCHGDGVDSEWGFDHLINWCCDDCEDDLPAIDAEVGGQFCSYRTMRQPSHT
jgi:hypothetical protein